MQTIYKLLLVLFFGLFAPAGTPSAADTDRVEHFEGQSAESLDEALDHLHRYNAQLAALIDADEITAETSYEVHELTYTLENALGRLAKELGVVRDTLERVHLASEADQSEVIVTQGQQYLEHSGRLFGLDQQPQSP